MKVSILRTGDLYSTHRYLGSRNNYQKPACCKHRNIVGPLFGAFTVIKDNLHQIAYRAAGKNLSEVDYNRCFIMLQEMARKINNSGGRLIILHWGKYTGDHSPLSDMSKTNIERNFNALSKYGAQVIPVESIIHLTDKKNFIPIDGHPSAVANRAIASWLANNISSNK